MPKSLALAHTERFALTLSGLVEVLLGLLAPLVWLLTRITNAVTSVLGGNRMTPDQMTTEELRLIVERSGEQGILEAEEEQMIAAVIELGERRLHEVMVPRTSIVAMAQTATMEECIDRIVEEGHSRIPIYESSVDEIIGILYAKDLLPFLKSADRPRPAIRSLLRTPVFVPESMSIDDLLHEFQRRKVHIAIVLDEYGGTAGLVTIEDLLEEIVGEIQDEYDVEEPMIERLSESEVRVDGRAAVDDLEELFDVKLGLDDEDEYDTVGGLIYHRSAVSRSPGPGAGRRPDADGGVDGRPTGRQGARDPDLVVGRGRRARRSRPVGRSSGDVAPLAFPSRSQQATGTSSERSGVPRDLSGRAADLSGRARRAPTEAPGVRSVRQDGHDMHRLAPAAFGTVRACAACTIAKVVRRNQAGACICCTRQGSAAEVETGPAGAVTRAGPPRRRRRQDGRTTDASAHGVYAEMTLRMISSSRCRAAG